MKHKISFGGAQEEAEKAADNEAMEKLKEELNEKFKKWVEFSNMMDNFSAETKCSYLIFKYKIEMDALIAETNATQDCQRKYDLLGMQLTTMLSSTTLMFCSEDLYNLLFTTDYDEEKREITKQLVQETIQILGGGAGKYISSAFSGGNPNYMDLEKTFLFIYQESYELLDDSNYQEKEDEVTGKIMETLLGYFYPESLLRHTIEISKQMDKLKPCTGY